VPQGTTRREKKVTASRQLPFPIINRKEKRKKKKKGVLHRGKGTRYGREKRKGWGMSLSHSFSGEKKKKGKKGGVCPNLGSPSDKRKRGKRRVQTLIGKKKKKKEKNPLPLLGGGIPEQGKKGGEKIKPICPPLG